MTMIGKVIHYSKNVGIYHVNDYQICRTREKKTNEDGSFEVVKAWFCSCSIKYNRDPKLLCKHVAFIKRKEE